jgi:hypothetical protein
MPCKFCGAPITRLEQTDCDYCRNILEGIRSKPIPIKHVEKYAIRSEIEDLRRICKVLEKFAYPN